MSGVLQITCPRCGKTGDVPASFAGKDIHCKKCDSHFIVPGPAEEHDHAHEPGHVPVQAHAPAHAQVQVQSDAAGHDHDHAHFAPGPPPTQASAPAAPQPAESLLDSLSDDAPLAPLSDDDEKHARQRYEARLLSKDRVAHYDDHGNVLSEAEYEDRVRQGRGSVH
jgi:hypothetical protein